MPIKKIKIEFNKEFLKLNALVKDDSHILINMSNDECYIKADFKDGIDDNILSVFSPFTFSFSFGEEVIKEYTPNSINGKYSVVKENVLLDSDQENVPYDSDQDRTIMKPKPALPHVESEYDEVKDKISTPLDSPVQTLYVNNESKNTKKHDQDKTQLQDVSLDENDCQEKVVVKENNELQNRISGLENLLKQLINNQQNQNEEIQEEEEDLSIDTIMSYDELIKEIKRASVNLPQIDTTKKMTKEQSIEYASHTLSKPCYVVSTVGQLIIDDAEVLIKPKVAINISSIPIFKLKNSSQLINCFKQGILKFVDYKTAVKLSKKFELTSATEGESELKSFVGADASSQAQHTKSTLNSFDDDDSESYNPDSDFEISEHDDEYIEDEGDISMLELAGGNFKQTSSNRQQKSGFVSKKWKPLSKIGK